MNSAVPGLLPDPTTYLQEKLRRLANRRKLGTYQVAITYQAKLTEIKGNTAILRLLPHNRNEFHCPLHCLPRAACVGSVFSLEIRLLEAANPASGKLRAGGREEGLRLSTRIQDKPGESPLISQLYPPPETKPRPEPAPPDDRPEDHAPTDTLIICGTKIATPGGPVPIDQLNEGDEVLARAGTEDKIIIDTITDFRTNQRAQSAEISLTDSTTLQFGAEQLVETEKGPRRACELVAGDRLLGLQADNAPCWHQVSGVKLYCVWFPAYQLKLRKGRALFANRIQLPTGNQP